MKVEGGHTDSLCKVLAQLDEKCRNESKNRETKKVLFEKIFLKLASETGLFCNSLSYGFCSHFYIICPIVLKLYTMMHNGLLQL